MIWSRNDADTSVLISFDDCFSLKQVVEFLYKAGYVISVFVFHKLCSGRSLWPKRLIFFGSVVINFENEPSRFFQLQRNVLDFRRQQHVSKISVE